jgi:hypothetical protein
MSKTLSFVRIDWKTVKPYFTGKTLWIYFSIMAVFAFTSSSPAPFVVGTGSILGYMYTSYPFAVGSKSNMDALYVTLGLKRSNVVVGRYIFSWLTELSCALASLCMSVLVNLITGKPLELQIALIMVGILFPVIVIMQSFQLPIYFKLGYTKGAVASYMPLLVMAAMVTFLPRITGVDLDRLSLYLETRLPLVIAVGIVFTVLVVMVSIVLSIRFYQKREF